MSWRNFCILLTVVQIVVVNARYSGTFYNSYKCYGGKCSRNSGPQPEVPRGTNASLMDIEHSTIASCRLSCNPHAALWPVPTGRIILDYRYVATHASLFAFDTSLVPEEAQGLLHDMYTNFLSNLLKFSDNDLESTQAEAGLNVTFHVHSPELSLDWVTDESYSLKLDVPAPGVVGTAVIIAQTVYGARHGLETLLQLTAPVINTKGVKGLVILRSATITDAPVYPHRGLTLDTSRNFATIEDIMRTIDGLSACKMNVLHWHATDSQSFPIEIKRVPAMTQYGAYSMDEIYTTDDMELLIAYGRVRGVWVLLEVDMPSHSGSGWDWGEKYGVGLLAACVHAQPWRSFCVEAPCGQLNPVNPNLYNVLRDIYKDLIDIWGPKAIFHMGGDEVFIPCWNSTSEITDTMLARGMGLSKEDFLQLWAEFQATLLNVVDQERGGNSPNVSSILWSSDLTEPATISDYLDKKRWIIQTWVPSSSPIPQQLLQLGYRLIVSTKDAWYLDHGVWGKTVYHNWRDVYLNRIPRETAVLGGEVAMWGEYIDGKSFDPRIWPRTAAVAERLWSDPPQGMTVSLAEPRLQSQRDRLSVRGIRPEAMTPEWCAQHDGQCL